MIDQFSGSIFVDKIIHNAPLVDVSPLEDQSGADWKYVMFPKTAFPTRDSLRRNVHARGDFAATKFQFHETDDIKELATFFVLTRMNVTSTK